MNKRSLEKELRNLKHYLKEVDNIDYYVDPSESKVICHTIVGMIMTIHNLVKTGAYHKNEEVALFKLIEHARNTAIHYGYFSDLDNIYPEAKNIIANIPQTHNEHFAQWLTKANFPDDTYHLIANSDKSEIIRVFHPEDFYKFKNKKTGEELYVKKEDLIIVENKSSNNVSYLLKANDDEVFFYKKNKDSESIKISFNTLLKNEFFKQFKHSTKVNKFTNSINRLLTELKENPYRNLVVKYKYDNKMTNITIHNLLKDLLYNRCVDERILSGDFSICDYDKAKENPVKKLDKITLKPLVQNASLFDIFFMELFIKRYQIYNSLKEEMSYRDVKMTTYTKQSMLINLFAIGAASFTDRFLKSDKSGTLLTLYHDYRSARNELAHFATSTLGDKEILISNLEKHSQAFYSVISEVYSVYCNEKQKRPLEKLPLNIKKTEEGMLINNKTNRYGLLKHQGICKMINGKKYLKLNVERKNVFVETDRTLLSLDYNTRISKECIIPIDYAKFVEIDCNTNKIKPINYKIKEENIIKVDSYMETLIQAHDLFKSYPQFKKRVGSPYLSVITFYDKFGTPVYTEGVKNLLYRRFAQKIIPAQLLEASTLIIPKDIDQPLQILNKNKVMVAKVYLACINNIDGKQVITQLLKSKEQKEINFGKLLPKDLKTNEIITITKEGRK